MQACALRSNGTARPGGTRATFLGRSFAGGFQLSQDAAGGLHPHIGDTAESGRAGQTGQASWRDKPRALPSPADARESGRERPSSRLRLPQARA